MLLSAVIAAALSGFVFTPDQCRVETFTFSSSGDFCIEEEQICCTEDVCRFQNTIACFPDKLFVGNFESLSPN